MKVTITVWDDKDRNKCLLEANRVLADMLKYSGKYHIHGQDLMTEKCDFIGRVEVRVD